MRTALILSLFAAATHAETIYPLPSILTSAGLTVPHLTESAFLSNETSFDQTFNLVAVGGRLPLGTPVQLSFNVLLKTQPDVYINRPFEELGGDASFQLNDLPSVYIDGFYPGSNCSSCGGLINIVFGEPFTVRIRATSRVWYTYSPGNAHAPQQFTGNIIPADSGSLVQIQSLQAFTATGLRDNQILLNTAGAPEPSTVLLAVSGIAVLLWRKKARL